MLYIVLIILLHFLLQMCHVDGSHSLAIPPLGVLQSLMFLVEMTVLYYVKMMQVVLDLTMIQAMENATNTHQFQCAIL